MWKWIKKVFTKQKPIVRRYRTDQEIAEEEEEEELLILSDPSVFGDIARKHHG